MSHPEQREFFTQVAKANTPLIEGGRILEIGSYDVNGTIRAIFAGHEDYVGVDLKEGPGVDVVSYGHEFTAEKLFDVAISGECFEHDPHWADTFVRMAELTRPGGLVAFSCASLGRPEHGTARTDRNDSPGTQAQGLDYYKNLVEDDFAVLPLEDLFSSHSFWYMRPNRDLYFVGVRSGATEGKPNAKRPTGDSIAAIERLMPLPDRIVRLPLALAERSTKSPEKYQRRILPYWMTMQKIFSHRRG